ncbi:MAG: hypothetical protein V9G42_04400 [Bacteroidia bacterium]
MLLFRLVIISFLFSSCTPSTEKKEIAQQVDSSTVVQTHFTKIKAEPGKLLSSIKAESNSSVLFSVYTPSESNDTTPLPVVYFFDPHADGNLPLEKYKSIADAFKLIMIGCNSIENGMPFDQSQQIASALFSDCQNRLPVNTQQQIVAGFSGGSKVACNLAMSQHFFSGLIACSGAMFENGRFDKNMSVVSVAGINDFNYHEMVALEKSVDVTHHAFIETDSSHQWPGISDMHDAILFTIMNMVKQNKLQMQTSVVEDYYHNWLKKINSSVNKASPGKRFAQLQFGIMCFEGLTDVTNLKSKLKEIENSDNLRKWRIRSQNMLYQEKEMQKMLRDAFSNQNLAWWQKEITDLKIAASNSQDKMMAAMSNRLLGFIGIACYSFAKQLVGENAPESDKVLQIYQIAEPNNSEAWFLSAVYKANNKQPEKALSDFNKAVQNGFNQTSRINEYPALQQIVAP